MTEQLCNDFKQSIAALISTGAFTIHEIEQQARWAAINAALVEHKGNQCAAARQLKIHRNTLSRERELMKRAGALTITKQYRKPPASARQQQRRSLIA